MIDEIYWKCRDTLQVEGLDNFFVGGDITAFKDAKTAQKAVKDGVFIARNIVKSFLGTPLLRKSPLQHNDYHYVVSTGVRDGFIVKPLMNGKLTIVVNSSKVEAMKVRAREVALKVMMGEKLGFRDRIVMNVVFAKLPNTFKLKLKTAESIRHALNYSETSL